MTPDRATLDFFNRFPEEVRAEGEKLHKQGAVTQIFGNHLFVRGRVEDQGDVYRTTLRFDNSRWFGGCDSGDALSPPVFATMLERLARGDALPSSPNEVGEDSLQDLLEKRLGRDLTDAEVDFVSKLERRYRRYEMEQALFDHDLVRLHPRWPVDSYTPLQLWPVAPADILEFWNFVAYAFRKRRLSLPEWECMDPVTDIEETRERMAEWERQREVAQWGKRIEAINRTREDLSSRTLALRILITMNRARLQISEPGRRPAPLSEDTPPATSPAPSPNPTPPPPTAFRNLAKGEFADLAADFHEGDLVLDDASALLLSELIAVRPEDSTPDLDLGLDNEENCRLLARLFQQPLLEESIITLDEQPIARHSRPLRWRCDPPSSSSSSAPYYLRLETADGEDIPHSLRALPGRVTLYLSDETVFPGPQNWTGGTEVEPSYEIPPEALDCDAGVEFLARIGAPPPPGIRERLRDVLLGVKMELSLTKKLSASDSEHLLVRVSAKDADAIREERLSKDGWEVTSQKSADEGGLVRFDRSLLHRFPFALEPMNLTYDPHLEAFKTRITKPFPARFTDWLDSIPKGVEIESEPELLSLTSAPVEASVRFEVEGTDIDWFDLKVVVDVDGHDLSQEEIRALVAARGDFVRMDNGGWLRLQMKLDKEQEEAIAHLGLDIFDLSGEKHRMHVLQLSDPKAKEVFDQKAWEDISTRAASLKLQVRPSLPGGLKLDLRPYQVEGFHFLAYLASNRFGGILADDMGLGKTVQAITWLLWLREKNGGSPTLDPAETTPPYSGRPVLIVCPKSVLDVWAGEVRKFAPDLRVQVLRNKEELDVDTVKSSVDLLVVNYAQLRVCAEPLTSISWLACVLDEGQQIKNPDSKAAQTAREITADHRLVLTGTPIENRLLDVWSLMAFSMPGVLGDRAYFRKRFDRRKDPNSQVRLAARLRPFLLRRTKRQVALDLPPRTEEDVFCKLEGSQDELYKAELERIQRILLGIDGANGLRKSRFAILQGLMRLRQICCHPDLVDSSGDGESAKMTALFYLLDQLKEEGHKVLVFSQFVTMLDLIKDRLEEEKRPYHYLTGQTQNRQEVVSDFQSTDEASVFLLSLKAGGSGLNLTAASYVVLYDPWWNPAVENQAIDRTHRIGQNNPVIAYRLLMRDTVEEKIRLLQNQKHAMAEGVLGEEGFASNLKLEDLKYLFSIDSD